MNNTKTIVFAKQDLTNPPQNSSFIRAKSFKISSAMQNFAQYVRTVKAYALAGLPLEHIANAGEEIGDIVERQEIDASVLESSQSKAGEIAEDENKILAWQNRGEKISIVNQLQSAQPLKETEIIPVTNNLTTESPKQEQTLNVVEGIAVFNNQPQPINTAQTNSQLESNPYLQAPADLKKATS